MVYYFFLIFFCCIILFIRKAINNKYTDKMFFLILLLVISLFSGLRDASVGTDSKTYSEIFYYGVNGIVGGFEPGFNILIIFISFFEIKNYSFYFLLISLIINYIYLYSIDSLAKYKSLSIILFLTVSLLYFFEFNVIRQSIAISIFLFSVVYFIKNKYKISFFLIFLATMFHYSAIFLYIVYVVYLLTKENKILLILSPFIVVFIINLLFGSILDMASIILNRGNVYSDYGDFSENSGFGFIFLFNLTIYLFLIFFSFHSNYLKSNKFYIFNVVLFSYLLAFNICISFLGMRYEGLGRLMNYFFISYIFSIPYLIDVFKQKYKAFIIVLFYLVSILYAFILLYLTNINQLFPYKIAPWSGI